MVLFTFSTSLSVLTFFHVMHPLFCVYLSLFAVMVNHVVYVCFMAMCANLSVFVCVCLQERRALERKISEMEEELKVLFVCVL